MAKKKGGRGSWEGREGRSGSTRFAGRRGGDRRADRLSGQARAREQEERLERDRERLLAKFADRVPDGLVICQFGTHAETLLDTGEVKLCLLTPKVHRLFGVCVGDRVWTERGATDAERIVVARQARLSEVRRKRGEEDRRGHVIAANVEQMAITAALVEPPLRTGALDRYLVLASTLGLEPLLVLTKVDRTPLDHEVWDVVKPYRELGVPTVVTSAVTGQGMDDLRGALKGRLSVFSGHSGVGKSTLCQALDLQDAPEAGELSRSGGRVRGRHKTSVARLLSLPEGGWIVDTPGVRAIGLVDLQPVDAGIHFPDLMDFAGGCAFADCLHAGEDDCGVRAAVEEGSLSATRYEGYLRLIESLAD